MTAEIAFALWLLLFVCVAGDGARRAYRGVRPRAIRAMPTKAPEWVGPPRASATAARFASKRSRRWAPPSALLPANPHGSRACLARLTRELDEAERRHYSQSAALAAVLPTPAPEASGGQSDRALWAQVNAARTAFEVSTPRCPGARIARESAPIPRKPPSGSPVKTESLLRDW